MTANFYTLAIILGITWIILFYLMFNHPGRVFVNPHQRRAYRGRFGSRNNSAFELKDAEQLHAVGASFERRRLLNRSEYRTFKIIESELAAARQGYRAFAQINLGEVLSCPDAKAFHSINSKRVDILVVDRGGWPVVAVEYQGEGHYQGNAAARDAIKKEALVKAGIGYVEIFPSDTPDEIRIRLSQEIRPRVIEPSADPIREVG
jgi:hypothetical protein